MDFVPSAFSLLYYLFDPSAGTLQWGRTRCPHSSFFSFSVCTTLNVGRLRISKTWSAPTSRWRDNACWIIRSWKSSHAILWMKSYRKGMTYHLSFLPIFLFYSYTLHNPTSVFCLWPRHCQSTVTYTKAALSDDIHLYSNPPPPWKGSFPASVQKRMCSYTLKKRESQLDWVPCTELYSKVSRDVYIGNDVE